ncbi:MAG: DUF4177 domain-containing protein [Pararhodobacter sp.]|nr:DUF4177 domain-containing protein [Pararhodobacter sp.]
MEDYEYKVIPAPARTVKVKGLKTAGERFAHLLSECLNEAASEGWEYVRAESLPCEERKGLMSTARSSQVVLIFRRQLPVAPVEEEAYPLAEPEPAQAAHSAHPIPHFRSEPALGSGAPALGEAASRREPVLRARPADEPASGEDRDER